MTRNFLEDDVGSVLSGVLRESDDAVYVVNPERDTIPELVYCLHDVADPPRVRLLAAEDLLKEVMGDFIIAGHAADLVDVGTLSIRVLEDRPRGSLVVSESAVTSVVAAGDSVGGLTATDEAFVTETRETYDHQWAAAEEFGLRTPPLSRVRETLAVEIDPDAAEDFDAVLDSLDVAKGDGEGLDEVTISLLVAARNGELLYDISKWGEDVSLASKATFSRTKTRLEDAGLIDTEKVPIDVGRPRLRLRLGDDRLREADPAELAELAQERLYD